MNKEERFDEAIERMKLLKLDKQCIEAFKKGKVWESEGFEIGRASCRERV